VAIGGGGGGWGSEHHKGKPRKRRACRVDLWKPPVESLFPKGGGSGLFRDLKTKTRGTVEQTKETSIEPFFGGNTGASPPEQPARSRKKGVRGVYFPIKSQRKSGQSPKGACPEGVSERVFIHRKTGPAKKRRREKKTGSFFGGGGLSPLPPLPPFQDGPGSFNKEVFYKKRVFHGDSLKKSDICSFL